MFIPIAEESEIVIPIGEWGGQKACKAYVAWKEQGIALETIAINLLSIQFQQENLRDTLCAILHTIGVDAHNIALKITNVTSLNTPNTT